MEILQLLGDSFAICLVVIAILSIIVCPIGYFVAKEHFILAGIYVFLMLFLLVFAHLYVSDRDAKRVDLTECYFDKNIEEKK